MTLTIKPLFKWRREKFDIYRESPSSIKVKVNDKNSNLLERLQLLEQQDKHPIRLSGGKKLRVTIIRILSIDPQLLSSW